MVSATRTAAPTTFGDFELTPAQERRLCRLLQQEGFSGNHRDWPALLLAYVLVLADWVPDPDRRHVAVLAELDEMGVLP